MKVIVKTLAVLGLAAAAASAQSMEETVQKLSGEASKQYIAPMVSGLGASMNAGWYHKAPAPKKFGFHIEGGVVMMGALLSGGAKTFETQDEFTFNETESEVLLAFIDTDAAYAGLTSSQKAQLKDSLAQRLATVPNNVTISGPTITGSKDDHVEIQYSGSTFATGLTGASDPNNQMPDTVTIPANVLAIGFDNGDTLSGLELPFVLMPTPQLTIGTIYGTNFTLRYMPAFTPREEIGTIKFFGFGVQHNPGVWVGSKMPVDLSVGYFTQKLEVGDIFKASSTAYGLNLSKTLGWRFFNVTPYGGVQYETSEMQVTYQRTVTTDTGDQDINVDFTLEGENKYRATTGLSIRLLAININADYNFAKYPSASVGVMVGI
jgi:hypothetical protein